MGLIFFLASSFMEGWRNGQQGQQGQQDKRPASCALCDIPYTCHLTYPALLPSFEELAANGHDDPRAILYTMLHLDVHRKKPFSADGLNAQDFGNGKSGGRNACKILLEKGLIRRLDRERMFAELYTVPELKVLLRKLELPVSGNKPVLVKRLVDSGFKPSGRNYRYEFLELTGSGIGAIEEYRSDEKRSFFLAVDALKEGDYSGAISAYRRFDDKWGFAHTSGKEHTIFAHYDVPASQFKFIATYPMRELRNSDDFKNTLRACLIAGLMGKGCPHYVGEAFQEQIQCPHIVDLYRCGHFDDGISADAIAAMRENIESDNAYVLQYYISRVMYLSRQARK